MRRTSANSTKDGVLGTPADEIRRLQERIEELQGQVQGLEQGLERASIMLSLSSEQAGPCINMQRPSRPLAQAGPCINMQAGERCMPMRKSAPRRAASLLSQGVPLAHDENVTITISKNEYELLLLKDQAISVLHEGITIADARLPDMPLIFANAGFSKITGYSWPETLGKNCRFLQGEGTDEATVTKLRESIKAGRACVVQLMNYKKNGDPFVNYLSVTPIFDAHGTLTHYVGIQSDITELVNHKKAELAAKHAALQAAAATEAKSQFLARMSHEIRTPLNGMIAVGQLLAETALSPAQWDLVNTIRCSGETLLTLITDILDFSCIEANKMVLNQRVFKLETVMEAAMEIAGLRAAQKRLQVAYHIAEDTPRVFIGDAQRLQQILLNIVNNAVKFTEVGQVLLEVWAGPVQSPPPSSPGDPRPSSDGIGAAGASPPFVPPGTSSPMPSASALAYASGSSGSNGRGSVSSSTVGGVPDAQPLMLNFIVRDTGIGIFNGDIGKLFSSFTQALPTH
ncbi:hypothetical protein FOA52_002511 [Chlamydomonas sp. UWO 241]|nr:hypothetical protein FOA52_002511 [Chlamydomonas sp. UWO 241]